MKPSKKPSKNAIALAADKKIDAKMTPAQMKQDIKTDQKQLKSKLAAGKGKKCSKNC